MAQQSSEVYDTKAANAVNRANKLTESQYRRHRSKHRSRSRNSQLQNSLSIDKKAHIRMYSYAGFQQVNESEISDMHMMALQHANGMESTLVFKAEREYGSR
ncbi:unnamed protein product, partial [Ceratitis capitata]